MLKYSHFTFYVKCGNFIIICWILGKKGAVVMKKNKNLENVKNKRIWVALLIIFTVVYMVWRIFFTLPTRYGLFSLIMGVLLLVAEVLGVFDLFLHFWNTSKLKIPVLPVLPDDVVYPDVDVFIATYNEPESVLKKTIIGCLNMEYPDKSRVHIYLLDDGHRESIKTLAKKYNVNYITREDNEHAKAGNLNNALTQTSSPYLVTLDADMIPRNQFLMQSIPFFVENAQIRAQELADEVPKRKQTRPLGFLQFPQVFYNADAFQVRLASKNDIPNEQDYFHREIQLGKNASNSVVYSGSNTVFSRESLESVGGFTVGVITEDIATGISLQSAGYQCYALNSIQASGLAPLDLESLIKQRKRWARGCIQTFRKVNPLFKKDLAISQRLNYLNSIFYWYTCFRRFFFIITPIVFSVFNVVVVDAPLWQVLLFWLPFYLISTISFRFLSNGIRNSKWTNIYDTVFMLPLMGVIILETLCIKKRAFEVTPKTLQLENEKKVQWQLGLPVIILFVLHVLGLYNCITALILDSNDAYFIAAFWIIFNTYTLMMSIFFAFCKVPPREVERLNLPGTVTTTLQGITKTFELNNISELGLSMISSNPDYFDVNDVYKFKVKIDEHLFNLKAKLLRVDNSVDDEYKFVFITTPQTDDDEATLTLALYDRLPLHPTVTKHRSMVHDIYRNIKALLSDDKDFKRETARVSLDILATQYDEKLTGLVLKEFNYHYLIIEHKASAKDQSLTIQELDLPLTHTNLTLTLKKRLKDKSLLLYKIENELTDELVLLLQQEFLNSTVDEAVEFATDYQVKHLNKI